VLEADYSMNDNLSFYLAGLYINKWTYRGTKQNDSFFIAAEVIYSLYKNVDMLIGYSNTGEMYSPENGTSDGAFYDDQNSAYYISTTLSF